MFGGILLRLLPIEERLSLKIEVKSDIWGKVGAPLDMISGISRRVRGFARFTIAGRKQMCGIHP